MKLVDKNVNKVIASADTNDVQIETKRPKLNDDTEKKTAELEIEETAKPLFAKPEKKTTPKKNSASAPADSERIASRTRSKSKV